MKREKRTEIELRRDGAEVDVELGGERWELRLEKGMQVLGPGRPQSTAPLECPSAGR